MPEDIDNKKSSTEPIKEEHLGFLKVDKLVRRSHAMNLLLRTDDIIVGFNGNIFKGSQKTLNQQLNVEEIKILTIFRKDIFFNIKASGPLGIKLLEVGHEESNDIMDRAKKYFEKVKSFDNFKEFDVYKGKNNYYDVLEINDASLMASLLPFVWFIHHKLYSPLLLLTAAFLLLGSIAWWLFLAAWVIMTIYMSKSSMSMLRGYCLFQEMRPYMKIFSNSNQSVQNIIRTIDKKSKYRFQLIDLPDLEKESEELETNDNLKASEAT